MLQILSGSYIVIFYAVDIVKDTGGAIDSQVSRFDEVEMTTG